MIEEISEALGGAGSGVVYALLAVVAVALVAQVAALVDLARRERVLWDRKWAWVLIILFLNSGIGAILWFVLGRRVPQSDPAGAETRTSVASDRAQRAVDTLYGESPEGSGDDE